MRTYTPVSKMQLHAFTPKGVRVPLNWTEIGERTQDPNIRAQAPGSYAIHGDLVLTYSTRRKKK